MRAPYLLIILASTNNSGLNLIMLSHYIERNQLHWYTEINGKGHHCSNTRYEAS